MWCDHVPQVAEARLESQEIAPDRVARNVDGEGMRVNAQRYRLRNLCCAAVLAATAAVFSSLALAAPISATPSLQSVSETTGSINLTSLPNAATVWLDGIHLGTTPLLLAALPPGHHTITMTKNGWQTQEFPLQLDANAVLLVSRRLKLATHSSKTPQRNGLVFVHGTVDEGSLRIDDRLADPSNTAGLTLAPGAHTVSAAIVGRMLKREFRVLPDTESILVLDAPPADTTTHLVAPAGEGLPAATITFEGGKIVIRNYGHLAVGHLHDPSMRIDGAVVQLDSAPVLVGQKLYLPVGIIDRLNRR